MRPTRRMAEPTARVLHFLLLLRPPHMNLSLDLVVFLIGTFAAAFVTGLSGFAFGLVAAAVWLQALAPAQTTALIVAYALIVQGYAVLRLRKSVMASRLWPFIFGSAVGVPMGLALLNVLAAGHLKLGIAVTLILFSLYNLFRPKMPSVSWLGRPGDGVVGVLNGVLGGATGLAGILVVIWSSLRGWPPNEQRAVFQPTAVVTFAMCLAAFGSTGLISGEVVRLFAFGLPALLLGTIAGWALYGKLDEAMFRKVVLWLLLASGISLLVPGQ
jgi:uncharacterized protein